ncbi:MAG: SDR family NAD(P)-dependent oxidoreductase, partial [Candidatus Buchananbacteria bacterium]
MKIENKIIVITGGNKGFGKSLATAFIGKGNKVVAVGRSAQDKSDGNYFEMIGDVTVEADIKKVVEDVVAKFGQIDIWINNAGKWTPHGPVEDLDLSRAREVFEVNVFGLMNGSKQSLIQMKKQGQGIILNILSTAALDGRAQASIYRSSKFAADGFTKCLRDEVKDSGIKVFSVYPGGMKTN